MDKRKHHNKDLIEEALAAVKRLGVDAQIERWDPKSTAAMQMPGLCSS